MTRSEIGSMFLGPDKNLSEMQHKHLLEKILKDKIVCDNYQRPVGVLGGPCLICGYSQPEHANARSFNMLGKDGQQITTTSGKPIEDDHRELDPLTGQQKDYIVLTTAERAKGFVRPVRKTYKHLKCGAVTTMSVDLAETYARDPKFYSGTFCVHCRVHSPLVEFVWEPDGSQVGS